MKPTRRSFMAGTLSLSALSCRGQSTDDSGGSASVRTPAPDRPMEPQPWMADGTVDLDAFAQGICTGDVTDSAALVHCPTTEVDVELVVVRGEGDAWIDEVSTVLTADDGVVKTELTGLMADTVYRMALFSADGTRRSEVARIRTAIAPGQPARKVVFGATSCLGSADPTFASLSKIAAYDLDFCLLLGDTVYADGSVSMEAYRRDWREAFATTALRELVLSTSIIGTWDDHEVANNWTLGESSDPIVDVVSEEQLATATAAFREAVPQRVGPGGSGLWRKVSWGDVLDVFMLDCRGERSDTEMISAEQLTWVTDGLRASTATFKIVASSVHLTDHIPLFSVVEAEDRWQGFVDQRDALIRAIEEVSGVVVITGDMHYGAVQYVGQPGETGSTIPEIAAGPAGSQPVPIVALAELAENVTEEQYPILLDQYSSCRLVADPGTGTVTVEFVGADGSVLAASVLEVA